MKKRIVSLLFATLVFAVSVPYHNAVFADTIGNGSDPIQTGCANDAKTVRSDDYGYGDAKLELRYSPSCRTAWARITLLSSDATKGYARITRDQDGVNYSCDIPPGKRSCYTLQVYDGGFTAHASGWYYMSEFDSWYELITGSY